MGVVAGSEHHNYEDWLKINTGDNIGVSEVLTTITNIDELNREFAVISPSQGLLGSVQQSYIEPDKSTGISKISILREEVGTKQEPEKIVIHTIQYEGKNDEKLEAISNTMKSMNNTVNDIMVKWAEVRKEDARRREEERKEDERRIENQRREDKRTNRIMRRITWIGIIITVVLGLLTFWSDNRSSNKLIESFNKNHAELMKHLTGKE